MYCPIIIPRYTVYVTAASEWSEAMFVFFATVAEQVIGKRLEVLIFFIHSSVYCCCANISPNLSELSLDFNVNEKGLHCGQLSFLVVTKVHLKTNVFVFNKLSYGPSSPSSQACAQTSKACTLLLISIYEFDVYLTNVQFHNSLDFPTSVMQSPTDL